MDASNLSMQASRAEGSLSFSHPLLSGPSWGCHCLCGLGISKFRALWGKRAATRCRCIWAATSGLWASLYVRLDWANQYCVWYAKSHEGQNSLSVSPECVTSTIWGSRPCPHFYTYQPSLQIIRASFWACPIQSTLCSPRLAVHDCSSRLYREPLH